MRITRHPQMVGQLLWCAAHTAYVGSSFMCVTSALLCGEEFLPTLPLFVHFLQIFHTCTAYLSSDSSPFVRSVAWGRQAAESVRGGRRSLPGTHLRSALRCDTGRPTSASAGLLQGVPAPAVLGGVARLPAGLPAAPSDAGSCSVYSVVGRKLVAVQTHVKTYLLQLLLYIK